MPVSGYSGKDDCSGSCGGAAVVKGGSGRALESETRGSLLSCFSKVTVVASLQRASSGSVQASSRAAEPGWGEGVRCSGSSVNDEGEEEGGCRVQDVGEEEGAGAGAQAGTGHSGSCWRSLCSSCLRARRTEPVAQFRVGVVGEGGWRAGGGGEGVEGGSGPPSGLCRDECWCWGLRGAGICCKGSWMWEMDSSSVTMCLTDTPLSGWESPTGLQPSSS